MLLRGPRFISPETCPRPDLAAPDMEFTGAGLWPSPWKKIPEAAEELEGPLPAATLDGVTEGPAAKWRLESRYLSSARPIKKNAPFYTKKSNIKRKKNTPNSVSMPKVSLFSSLHPLTLKRTLHAKTRIHSCRLPGNKSKNMSMNKIINKGEKNALLKWFFFLNPIQLAEAQKSPLY